jgi:Fe-Mn family superoxide dismutase
MRIPFPSLPYSYDALEPFIDQATMELHYDKHHRSYHDKLESALEKIGNRGDLPLEKILCEISEYPTEIRNNGGGHFNHCFFWESMTPVSTKIHGQLRDEIERKWSSPEGFYEEFSTAAKNVFGSGFVWLIVDDVTKQLEIVPTANQDNPLMNVVSPRGLPVLALDVWEHAYYLRYQNRRPEYIGAWWNVVDWDRAEKRYSRIVGRALSGNGYPFTIKDVASF